MRHGFKAQAEKISLELRDSEKLSAFDRLDAKKFLESQGIIVWEPHQIPEIPQHTLKQLVEDDPDSWSGCTIKENNLIAVIINSTDPSTRQANTLMHEWSHIKLRHKVNRVDRSQGGLLLLSDYPSDIEDEANWLAGAMLAPRTGLVGLRKRGLDAQAIADNYGISRELTNWRLRMTGVEKQIRAGYYRG